MKNFKEFIEEASSTCNKTIKGKYCPTHGTKDCNTTEDHEHSMARSELSIISNAAKRLRKKMEGEGNIKAWVQSKITKAADYIDTAADYVDSQEIGEACWKGYKKKGMKKMFGKKYPNCVKVEEVEVNNPRIPRKPGQPARSKKHSDLYTDENPKGTIHGLGFKDVQTAKESISKIKNSKRSHAHKMQAAIAMEQRAKAAGKTSEAAIYRKFINSMKEKTKEMNEEGLRDWFGKSKSKDVNIDEAGSLHHWFQGSSGITKSGKRVKGWVQADGSPCANEPGETKTPKCFSSARLAALKRKGKRGESIIQSAIRRKRQKDSKQPQKSKAAKPTNVPTFAKGRKSKDYVKPEPGLKETMEIQEAKDKKGKGSGTKDACYHKVKSRYRVWPSAYASGALVKCRRVGADNWGNSTKNEEMNIEENYLRIQSRGSTYTILLNWRGKYITTQMFFQQFNRPTKSEVTREIRKVYPDAIILSFNPTTNDPNKPLLFTGETNGPKSYRIRKFK
jgi:hypothetical protein